MEAVSLESKGARGLWMQQMKISSHVYLTHWLVLQSVKSLLDKKYSHFDAQTTTNCCHGMAMLSKQLIDEANTLDLATIETDLEVLLIDPDKGSALEQWIPDVLLELAALYMLQYVSSITPGVGRKTSSVKLKQIASIGTTYCNEIISCFRKYFSNKIACSYEGYYKVLPQNQMVSGLPIALWGKYVESKYLRECRRGLLYASSVYSMKVLLGYLIHTKAKIVLLNDINNGEGELIDRYVRILQGDGKGDFIVLSEEKALELVDSQEAFVVFAGCSIQKEENIERIHEETNAWLNRFPSLILANYSFYPQFPKVGDDPHFNSAPITPDEHCIIDTMDHHAQYKGVHATDFSTYYVTHLYTSSIQELLEEQELPNSSLFLPKEESYVFKKTC